MNKQIEEMAESVASTPIGTVKPDLTLTEMRDVYKGEFINRIAKHLVFEGYRKQKEGEWVLHKPRMKNRNATYKCSNCGKLCSSYYNDVGEWKCCPHCFAKMKGGAEE